MPLQRTKHDLRFLIDLLSIDLETNVRYSQIFYYSRVAMNKDMEKLVRKVSIGVIILVILFFALVTCSEDTSNENNKNETKIVVEPQSEPELKPEPQPEPEILGGKIKGDLYAVCKEEVQNRLKNPRSMDADIYAILLDDMGDGTHDLWFEFYAKNSFNADIIHMAKCSFDSKTGDLLSADFAEK